MTTGIRHYMDKWFRHTVESKDGETLIHRLLHAESDEGKEAIRETRERDKKPDWKPQFLDPDYALIELVKLARSSPVVRHGGFTARASVNLFPIVRFQAFQRHSDILRKKSQTNDNDDDQSSEDDRESPEHDKVRRMKALMKKDLTLDRHLAAFKGVVSLGGVKVPTVEEYWGEGVTNQDRKAMRDLVLELRAFVGVEKRWKAPLDPTRQKKTDPSIDADKGKGKRKRAGKSTAKHDDDDDDSDEEAEEEEEEEGPSAKKRKAKQDEEDEDEEDEEDGGEDQVPKGGNE